MWALVWLFKNYFTLHKNSKHLHLADNIKTSFSLRHRNSLSSMNTTSMTVK